MLLSPKREKTKCPKGLASNQSWTRAGWHLDDGGPIAIEIQEGHAIDRISISREEQRSAVHQAFHDLKGYADVLCTYIILCIYM